MAGAWVYCLFAILLSVGGLLLVVGTDLGVADLLIIRIIIPIKTDKRITIISVSFFMLDL
jgi:hypothetical protein